MAGETKREQLEARLEQLEGLRDARAGAKKRRLWTVSGILGAVTVALTAAFTVVDLGAGGMSPRHPLFWLVGLVGIAALPALYFALKSPDESPFGSSAEKLTAVELEHVIRHVKDDLRKTEVVAPAQALQLVEPGEGEGEGGLSVSAPEEVEGGLSVEEPETIDA